MTGDKTCAIVRAIAIVMDKKPVRKPRNIYINPDALHEAHVEVLRARKTLGQRLEEAMEEKIEREQKQVK